MPGCLLGPVDSTVSGDSAAGEPQRGVTPLLCKP